MQIQQQLIEATRTHPLIVSIGLFFILYIAYCKASPSFSFDKNGRAKQFGIGIRNRTVTPVWIVAILIAISSYLVVLHISNSTI